MWVTASQKVRRTLLAGWIMFAGVNTWLMWTLPGVETIPFHFVWISIALVFGLHNWRLRVMMWALAAVTVVTSVILVHHALLHYIGIEETSEVPLMAAVFLVMVWHVRRRQMAVAELERIAAAERMRSDAHQVFVRMSSHELRTPITVARGYAELVRAGHTDPQLDADIAIVLDELGKLDRMTARLNTLMRLDSSLETGPLDLDLLVEQLVHRWSPVAGRRWEARSAVGVVEGNEERITAALDSLIENAVKFTDVGDAIMVNARREGASLVIEVSDTGEGISAADLPHVFETFRSGSDIGAKAGTGLGLAIVKAAMEARGGTATVRSEVGKGTTFTLRSPLVLPAAVPGASLVEAPAAAR